MCYRKMAIKWIAVEDGIRSVQTVEVKKAMVKPNRKVRNNFEHHGTKSAGKQYYDRQLPQPQSNHPQKTQK